MKDVVAFLKKHNYIVVVTQKDKGIEVKIPPIKNKFTTRDEKVVEYSLKYGKKGLVTKTEKNKEDVVIPVPEYALRLYVCADIVRECLSINYDFEFVEGINKKGECVGYGLNNEVIDLMKEPKIGEFEKEGKLFEIFRQCFDTGFLDIYEEYAEQAEIKDGYLLAKNLIESDFNQFE